MALSPSSQLPLALAPLLARGAITLSICNCPTLGARRSPTKHLPFLAIFLLYLLLLWQAACPRSERSVGGPARISLRLDFGAFGPALCEKRSTGGGGGGGGDA